MGVEPATALKLKDWANADKVGTRFPPSKQLCPSCGQPALEDTWPPDYGGGCVGPHGSESYGSMKFVCVPCRVAFRASYRERRRHVDDGTYWGKEEIEREVTLSETVPLVEMDGFLLTPHDVWREDVKKRTGKYPQEAYG